MEGSRLKSILLAGLILGFVAFSFLSYAIYNLLTQPMLSSNQSPVTLVVDKKTSAAVLVKQLESRQLIQRGYLLLALIRVQGLAHKLKAGIYQITPGESALQFLYRVKSGQVLVKSFRITEGTSLQQVISNLQNEEYLSVHPSDWQGIAENKGNPEGLFLADTYHYDAGSEAKSLLKFAHQKLAQYLEMQWATRSENLPYKNSYELLIVASILEKESALPMEKKIISGVVANRIRKNMPLQMDPTVIYALGDKYSGKLKHEDLRIDSPYNTYRYRGLPPTPIAMVGREAIEAAAHPMLSDYLYFVAKGDGSHHFSATYDEQKKAIFKYFNKRRQA
ncbi:MAG: endolytic transglycosylase MltG [Tatlockia sp.]|jgi:UPF0755 protein